jgi:hypothetical protein
MWRSRVGGRGRAGRTVLAFVRRLRDHSLKAADANVVLGGQMADHLVAWQKRRNTHNA